jgi:hypothetical protein
MHESIFSYNITRPYPYQWFTWLVVLGGIAATALFSVINLAANGYDARQGFTPPKNICHLAIYTLLNSIAQYLLCDEPKWHRASRKAYMVSEKAVVVGK